MLKHGSQSVRTVCGCAARNRIAAGQHAATSLRPAPILAGPSSAIVTPRSLRTSHRPRHRSVRTLTTATSVPSESSWAVSLMLLLVHPVKTADHRSQSLGVPLEIIGKLAENYPHIISPTLAQRLFLAAVGSGKEVFLKDEMGRGKTLALAVAALSIALQAPSSATRVVIIVPTPHLSYQIFDHLEKLSPDTKHPLFTLLNPPPAVKSTKGKSPDVNGHRTPDRLDLPRTPIVLATAKNFEQYRLNLPEVTHVFLDEPDTMLGSFPSKHLPSHMLAYHRINRHPPPVIGVLNTILRIGSTSKDKFDFSGRRDEVNTVWTSATMTPQFLRFVKTRGWVRRGKEAVNLDFTPDARKKDAELRERLVGVVSKATTGVAGDMAEPSCVHAQDGPLHYTLVVDPTTGDISSLEPGMRSSRTNSSRKGKEKAQPHTIENGHLNNVLLESLALLHAGSPPPAGQYALAFPPEGTSLDQLGEELSKLGVASSILTPEVMQLGLPPQDEDDASLILLAQRSSVPGLHLDKLHTIYLLSGLDVGGLSPKQRKEGGVKDRWTVYDLVAGRLGRLGTVRNDVEERQRVISLVMTGSEEESRLAEMFMDPSNEAKALQAWDMGDLHARIAESLDAGDAA